ncbi:MAG: LysM peptidoglycan-binding domain-containing protein [Pyrinomonadaceae bacterium]
MRRTVYLRSFVAFFVLIFGLSAIDTLAQKRKPTLKRKTTTVKRVVSPKLFTVESGTKIHARLNDTLSSKTAKVGDSFTANVTEPVYSTTGVVVMPAGSSVIGRVDTATPAKKGGNPGSIDVSFNQVKLPNGYTRSINGSLTDLNTDDAKSDAEGTASGDKMKHRKIIFIGGGGAGGAVLGAAIGGGKGALIGGIIGAAGGFLGERYTKGEEAEVKSGTEFGVYLNQSVSLPRFAEAGAAADEPRMDDPPAGGGQTYVVRPGDTLGKISTRFYGSSRHYMKIYEANRDKMNSPSDLEVGAELVIP